MTHHNATFIGIATDGDAAYLGLSENGTTAVGCFLHLDNVADILRREAALAATRPLIVAIGKHRPRATAGEKFLFSFALDIVRKTVASLPELSEVLIAGEWQRTPASYYHPRVTSMPLPWAVRNTPKGERLHLLLDDLALGDAGLDLIPKGLTYVGA